MLNPSADLFKDSLEQQRALRERCVHPSLRFVPFEKDQLEGNLVKRFEAQVQLYPDRLAIQTENESATYAELNTAANRIALGLIHHKVLKGQPIALLFSQDVNAVAAVLGVLKSANFFVPLDPSLPLERMRYMLEDSGAEILLTDHAHLSLAGNLKEKGLRILNIDDSNPISHPENPNTGIAPDNLAWIIYTSGSTGRPKGVMQSHRNVLHFMMNYINNFHICEEDRLSLLFPCSVNAGAYAALLPLMTGAGLISLNLKVNNGLDKLGTWLAESHITIYCSVPTVFRYLARTLSCQDAFPDLRLIYLSGEPVLKTDAELYQTHFGDECLFVNRLGCTETDCYSLYFMDKTTKISTPTVPVGYPVEDQEVLLVDQTGHEVPIGECGEIMVNSQYLSPGYWNRPDLTKIAFVSGDKRDGVRGYFTGDIAKRLPNGCLVHQGRKDFQVKIRGYRVEIAEIEMVMLELGTIKEVVVVTQKDTAGEDRLLAYFVPSLHPSPSCSELREGLSVRLPNYMIPSGFIQLEELPRAPNGKLYRRGLPEYQFQHIEPHRPFTPPETLVEQTLTEIWKEVLSIDQVGIHDVFLELGGHSLDATRIASRIRDVWKIELTLVQLFETPTIYDLGKVVESMVLSTCTLEEIEGLEEIENL